MKNFINKIKSLTTPVTKVEKDSNWVFIQTTSLLNSTFTLVPGWSPYAKQYATEHIN
jgi:hypothetical protein